MTKYVTLMASLPPLGKLFEAQQTPLSQLKLESRLKLLDAKDTQLLEQIVSLIAWSHQPLDRTEAQFIAEANQFLTHVRHPRLREIVTHRLDARTIVAALRHRHRGENTPPAQPWGVGQWVMHIERHWTEPGFHLEVMFPWVLAANRLLNDHDSVGLERLQFEINWKMLDRVGAGHYFDFEAVVIYLMRWSMVDRWTRYNGDAAVNRFRQLVDAGITEFIDIFAPTT